jgi:hypothetical protein
VFRLAVDLTFNIGTVGEGHDGANMLNLTGETARRVSEMVHEYKCMYFKESSIVHTLIKTC